ncbi:MAG: DUF5615 family PIN-like protein [Bacteroidales bacterium]|nr:DUF5615 family PIN-like protein [Bacteroidales bacterium]
MKISFLLDENIPFSLIQHLENKGYQAEHLKEMGKSGIKNGEVYQLAEQRGAWIITRDADFQNIKRFDSFDMRGIILFKLTKTKTEFLIKALDRFLDKFQEKLGKKHLIIIEEDKIKIY